MGEEGKKKHFRSERNDRDYRGGGGIRSATTEISSGTFRRRRFVARHSTGHCNSPNTRLASNTRPCIARARWLKRDGPHPTRALSIPLDDFENRFRSYPGRTVSGEIPMEKEAETGK